MPQVFSGRVPGIGGNLIRLRRHRPQLHPSGIVGAVGKVAQRRILADPLGRHRLSEDSIDQRQHRRGRAERDVERHVFPFLPTVLHPLAQQGAPELEGVGVGPLKAVDRLLAITDGEHRADHIRPCPDAGEEFLGQPSGDLPLRGRGVLHLIQQQMIQPTVELEQHPGRTGIEQQPRGAADQVLVIELAGGDLGLRVGAGDGQGGVDQRRGDLRHLGRRPTVLDGGNPGLFGLHQFGDLRQVRYQLGIDEGAHRPRPAGAEEFAAPLPPVLRPQFGGQPEPGGDPLPLLGHLRTAALADLGKQPQQVAFATPHRAGADVTGRRGAEQATQGFQQIGGIALAHLIQPVAVALQAFHQLAEIGQRGQRRQLFQRGPALRRVRLRQHRLTRLLPGDRGIPLVGQVEMRRKLRLQRKPPQQRLAERMNGADPHPAGQIEHPGEQRAGSFAVFRSRGHVDIGEFTIQRVVVQRHPFAEPALQPQRHFRGGGLGEGQALDARRLSPGQHQPQQPIGQQLGLARAGGGRDEGGNQRIGGPPLLVIGNLAGRLTHSPSPRSHSSTRANWP